MILEMILMCSLTYTAPYYDCSETWTVYVHDESLENPYCAKWGLVNEIDCA